MPVTVLAGLHSGCFELFAHGPIQSIGDLKGRKVGIQSLGSSAHLYMAIMAAQVGLDPHEDMRVDRPSGRQGHGAVRRRQVDAFLGFPPEPQELRARKIGRMILSTATDKPWSDYFCCMVFGNRDFVRAHPVATKRYLRAHSQSDRPLRDRARTGRARSDRCRVHAALRLRASDADRAPYARWRDFDPEDTMRFFALRLHEVGMIKSSPNAILAEGTDWRFLNELKRELKA